jgi:hypothetical protein
MTVSESAVDTRWQWHPEIRERWAGERLCFWRLSFPTYEQPKVVEGLEEVMRQVGVQAYAIYELYGGFDILLRVWLPTTQKVFESTFHEVFQNNDIVIEGLLVNEVVTHWPWASEDGSMRRLDADVIENKLPNSDIQRINDGLALTEVAEYQVQGLIAPAWHTRGIKFIVLVGASRHPMATAGANRLRDRLLKIVLDADDDAFAEKSVYRGLGFCAYLIIGRVRHDSFHLIEREITRPINDVIAPETFGARTTTFTMSTEDFLAFSERMVLDRETPHKRSAVEWLELDEGQHLEVKGSAFADLNQWLLSDPPVAAPPMSDVAVDSLMKAIVGLLNAEGGAIVLGALESKRYEGNPKLEGTPEVGPHRVLGLHSEMRDRGWDWDRYERALRDIMAARIQEDPNQYVDFQRDGIGARPVCVLAVREPRRSSASDSWFYHFPKGERHPRFWVREGNRTREKIGTEIDHYKREKTQRATDPS